MWLYSILKFILFLPVRLIFPVKVFRKAKLPKGKCIIASNHLSALDPVTIAFSAGRNPLFVAKKSVMESFIFGNLLTYFKFISAERDGSDFKAIKAGLKRVNEGNCVAIFPEGTRNFDNPNTMLPLKNGAALFAVKTNTDIYPVILKNKTRAFKLNYMIIGEKISFEEFTAGRITSDVLDNAGEKLEREMLKLQADFIKMLEEKYPKKFKKGL